MQSDKKLSLVGTFIWLVCALFFTYEFLLRTVLGTFQTPIMQDLGLSPMSFALMSTSAYLLVYGAMQIPVGFILEKYGLKKPLIAAIALCAMSGIAFSYTTDFSTAIACRLLTGFASSFGFVCLLMAVYNWMPSKRYGLFIGLSQFIGTMGPMLAAGPLNSLALKYGIDWRTVLFGLGSAGFPLVILVLIFVKNSNDTNNQFRIINKNTSAIHSFKHLLAQKQTWLIAFYSALVYFTLEYLSENEGKIFLEFNGYSSSSASYMITLGWLGYAIGCPTLGFLSDFFKRRRLIMIFAALSCLFSMITIVYFPLNRALLAFAFLMLGVGAGGQSIGFAIMAEQCNKIYLAAGIGFNNCMITLFSSINAPAIGYLLTSHSKMETLTISDYHFAFTFIIALIILSLILSCLFIKETYCRSTKELTFIQRHRAKEPLKEAAI